MLAQAHNRSDVVRFAAAGLFLLAAVGCSHTVGYETSRENVDLSPHRLPVRLALLRMDDARPQEQIESDGEFLAWWDKTEDEDWDDEDLPAAISEMAARHLDASGVFGKVDYVPGDPSKLDEAALADLHAKGYDAVLIGTIQSFTGTRRWDLARSGVFAIGGPIGAAANAALGHRAGGLVVFRPLRIVRTSDGAAVWEGDAIGDFQTTTYLTGTAPGYANDALRLALNNLTHTLDTDSEQIAVNLATRREELALPPAAEGEEDPTLLDRALNPAKKGIEGVGKAASKAGEAVDSLLDKVIDQVR